MNLNTNHKTYIEEPEEYRNYGEVDYEDHEIELKMRREELLTEELNLFNEDKNNGPKKLTQVSETKQKNL